MSGTLFGIRKEIPKYTHLKNDMKSDTTELENQMQDPIVLSELAFITDMTNHLNELNLKLQGKQQNIANLYSHLNGFKSKLKLFKSTLANNIFPFFPNCKEHFE